jgi:hypothetical protein
MLADDLDLHHLTTNNIASMLQVHNLFFHWKICP